MRYYTIFFLFTLQTFGQPEATMPSVLITSNAKKIPESSADRSSSYVNKVTRDIRFELKPSATNPWHIIDIGGRDYVTADSVRDFYNRLYGFTTFRLQGNHFWLGSSKLILKATIGSQEMFINNIKFILSFPVIESNGKVLFSRLDLCKLIDPVLCPNHIQNAEYFDTVVIDAGHGGQDAGIRGVYGNEKDYTLQLAQLLRNQLVALGFKVFLTRDGDTYYSLNERLNIANKVPKSILVHLGFYSKNKEESGIETRACSSDLVSSRYDSSNIALATAVHASVISTIKVIDRGVSRSSDPVLAGLDSPGIIFLGGNISNPNENLLVASKNYQKALVDAIAEAVVNYRRGLKPAVINQSGWFSRLFMRWKIGAD
jgi:N-acetylmuramoyl-L-alanine amidase